MKKVLIASLVGAVIVFLFQAASWMALPIHKDQPHYTAAQDEIMGTLSQKLQTDGVYMLPAAPADANEQQRADIRTAAQGKPWAMISYHTSYENNMASSMPIGFILDLLAAMIVAGVMLRGRQAFNTFGRRFWLTLGFATFTVLQARLMDWNWWHTPTDYAWGEIIDALLGWALGGLWMAWYMGRGQKQSVAAPAAAVPAEAAEA